jgi:hypothetical protein
MPTPGMPGGKSYGPNGDVIIDAGLPQPQPAPATRRYVASTGNVPGADYKSGWNNIEQQYGVTDTSSGKTPFQRVRQYNLTDDQYNQMKSNPYFSNIDLSIEEQPWISVGPGNGGGDYANGNYYGN